MAIGAYEQTILDMTAAYAGMANRGVFFTSPFEEIRGPKNEVLWTRRLVVIEDDGLLTVTSRTP